MSLRNQLKQATAGLHLQAEETLQIKKMQESLSVYRYILSRFYGFYAALEPKITKCLNLKPLGLDFSLERGVSWLKEDLRSLGMSHAEISGLPLCKIPLSLQSNSQAMGFAYVIEGSTIGGTILSQSISNSHGLSQENGCRFFYGYGTETQTRWRHFITVLDQYGQSLETHEEVIYSAKKTFQNLIHWLEARVK